MIGKSILVFVLGLAIGASGALLFLERSGGQLAAALASHEDVTESEALEHGVVEEGIRIEAGEATVTLPSFAFTTHPATSTSSPFSIRVPVMIYHSVRAHTEGESRYQDLYDVTPELLDAHLSYLEREGYTTITMRDVIAYWEGKTLSLPPRPIILSFDDGWKSQIEYALPVLQKHRAKAVFYVFTNPIDHRNPRWMSWDDVRALDHAGFEIGSHTLTHPYLTRIAGDDELDRELVMSKRRLEEELGHPVPAFAYPFGAKDERVERAVVAAGYTSARTTYSGVWNDPAHRYEFHGTLSSDRLANFERLLAR
jgi:peptidoglycan/xylan/chitin deacetylase (PgdA/CDA1 family)